MKHSTYPFLGDSVLAYRPVYQSKTGNYLKCLDSQSVKIKLNRKKPPRLRQNQHGLTV
ncbi:hypothetical protein QWZ13_05320 [Reinekea marina]|nr:hypothetical protein [Reinekea marina]MDN3648325.1 hypothetical protein [Reinekea marina]